MRNPITDAEIVKLARDLAVEPAELDFLRDSPAEALMSLRNAVAAKLDEPHRPMFKRLAKASALVPVALAATIAKKFFPPVLCGAVASEIAADKAEGFLAHMPLEFVTDISGYIDPALSQHLVQAIGVDVVVGVTNGLLAKGDVVTVARMVGATSDAQAAAIVPLLSDGDLLLDVLFYSDAGSGMARALDLAGDEQITALARAAVARDHVDVLRGLVADIDAGAAERVEKALAGH